MIAAQQQEGAAVRIGLIIPQGWTGEYAGWQPHAAWQRSVDLARRAEALGLDSIWLFDHFHTTPEPTDEMTFESFTSLSALAMATRHVRLGHIVSCAGFRNPALVAKMVSTMDVISGGRMELGIGAGWKEEEWRAYGYGFPSPRERLDQLEDALAIARRMFKPGRATYEGRRNRIDGAINEPRPLQPGGVPIMVGGNGRQRTWRLAARFADELNVDAMPPEELRDALPVLAERCSEVGRDPASLRVSVHLWRMDPERNRREPLAELLSAYAELGVQRVMALLPGLVRDDDPLLEYVELSRRAGAELTEQDHRPQPVSAGSRG